MQADLPVLAFDWNDLAERQIADNIWHAQQAGWPAQLTYVPRKDAVLRRMQAAWKRNIAMNTPGEEVVRILSRDEYPFACTREHRGSVWVGHVPASENSRQGGRIAGFLAKNGAFAADEPFAFLVRVLNHPLDGTA